MALQGKLQISGQGKEYGIVECAYEFHQSIDDSGKPTTRPRGGTITFVTPSTSDEDLFFYNWMFDKIQKQGGEFTFLVFTENNKISYKHVSFENAYCVSLKDYFNDNDSKLMYTTVTLSAEIITVGGKATFDNEWK